jgi:hypothetical protein
MQLLSENISLFLEKKKACLWKGAWDMSQLIDKVAMRVI